LEKCRQFFPGLGKISAKFSKVWKTRAFYFQALESGRPEKRFDSARDGPHAAGVFGKDIR
jgi:hypothetical protein